MAKKTLTPKKAEEIRWIRAKESCTFPSIAQRYGVTASTVASICHGRSFKTAGGPVEPVGSFRAYTIPDPPHGGSTWWSRGCRCDDCRDWNADRLADWRRRTGHNGHRRVTD